MKKKSLKKRINLFIPFALILGMVITSCSKEKDETLPILEEPYTKSMILEPSEPGGGICDNSIVCELIAGQFTVAGNVFIENDETNLYVTYESTGGWYMSELHLFVGEIQSFPMNKKGNPKIGNFPYSVENLDTLRESYTFVISLNGLPECYVIAAHAVVYNENMQEETAWAKCFFNPETSSFLQEFIGKRWGWLNYYCNQECICYEREFALGSGIPYTDLTGASPEGCVLMYDTYVLGSGWQTYNLVSYWDYSNVVGEIRIMDDGENLAVIIEAGTWYDPGIGFIEDLMLETTFLFVGSETGLVESANGTDCPIYTNFIFQQDAPPYNKQHIYNIPLEEIDFDQGIVFALKAYVGIPGECI